MSYVYIYISICLYGTRLSARHISGSAKAQTRGSSFCHYMLSRLPERTYEVDTVLQDGRVLTSHYPVAACGTLGRPEARSAFMKLPEKLPGGLETGLRSRCSGRRGTFRAVFEVVLAHFDDSLVEAEAQPVVHRSRPHGGP